MLFYYPFCCFTTPLFAKYYFFWRKRVRIRRNLQLFWFYISHYSFIFFVLAYFFNILTRTLEKFNLIRKIIHQKKTSMTIWQEGCTGIPLFNVSKGKILNQQYFYVLAVSGGPDSMFLLDNLRQKGYRLAVAHVNYHKRKESDRDEKLVKRYCRTWNLPCFVCPIESSEQLSAKNFQAWAREKRYSFFRKIAQQNQTKYILTAHHLNDHLETYLFQKQRKSLVKHWGLSSKVRWKDVYILRPLIHLSKEQIYQYLSKKKIPYVIDQTNYLPTYQRNIIRQKMINFSAEKKERLFKEIVQKNQELHQIELLLKKKAKKVIANSTLNLNSWATDSPELKIRLLYYWINKNTNQEFVNRKKGIFWETKKQLESPKKILTIILNKNYRVQKNYPWANIEKNLP